MKHIVLLLFSLQSMVSFSQSELAEKVMAVLESDSTNWNLELIVEKVVPTNTEESILVLPVSTYYEEDYFGLKTWVVRVNNQNGTILNKTTLHHESDAIILKSYTIDTAPYNVSPHIRAFGIRASYANQSQPNPYQKETLTLLVNSRLSLNVILRDYEVEMFSGETDTNCAGEFVRLHKILMLQPESADGYFDIIIKNTITEEVRFVNEQNDCDSNSTISVENIRLKYTADQYQEVH